MRGWACCVALGEGAEMPEWNRRVCHVSPGTMRAVGSKHSVWPLQRWGLWSTWPGSCHLNPTSGVQV